jgi:Las17-binding protein actin regulator
MKDCFSTLAFSRKTAYGRSGAPQLRIVLFSLLVYLAGCPAFAAVYTYSRSQGLFAGASLEGTILVAQSNKNARYYGGPVTPEQILSGGVAPPPSARQLVAALSQY